MILVVAMGEDGRRRREESKEVGGGTKGGEDGGRGQGRGRKRAESKEEERGRRKEGGGIGGRRRMNGCNNWRAPSSRHYRCMRVNELYVLFCSVLLDFNGVSDMYSSKLLLEKMQIMTMIPLRSIIPTYG